MTDTPPQPPWGRFLQERRERQGRSIRQAALHADVSDAYWGQVERGYQTSKSGGIRLITPSRAKLVEMAEVLRLTTKDTNELLRLANYPPLTGAGEGRPTPADYVDLTGLSRRDIRLLGVIADRLREAGTGAVDPADTAAASRRLQAVADQATGTAAQQDQEAATKARRARRRNTE